MNLQAWWDLVRSRLDGPDVPIKDAPASVLLEDGGKKLPEPRADREVIITYRVQQITTASDHGLQNVIDRFRKEVELQFGSTVDIAIHDITGTDWEPEEVGAIPVRWMPGFDD